MAKEEGSAIDKSIGAVGSGSLMLLALLLIFDGIFGNIFSAVEGYSKSEAFGIVAAIPALTIAYMIGMMILTGSELFVMWWFPKSRDKERKNFALIAAARNDILTKQFEDIIRFRRVLEGSFLPLLALLVGVSFQILRLRWIYSASDLLQTPVTWIAIAVLLLAVLCPIFSTKLDSPMSKIEQSAKDSLRTNLSLSLECDRKPLDDHEDELCIRATLSKGDRGTIALHDAQAHVCYRKGEEYVPFTDILRLSFDPSDPDPTKRKTINWARMSANKPFINLAPGEVTQMACNCRVPHQETCKVEVVVLGFHFWASGQTEGTMGQWRASCVSPLLTKSENGTTSSKKKAELPS